MLVKLNGMNDLRRVQCPFISEEELERVTSFLRRQGNRPMTRASCRLTTTATKRGRSRRRRGHQIRRSRATCARNTTLLDVMAATKLTIGYNRAAKIVEMMEKRGLVGPANGARERDVLLESL